MPEKITFSEIKVQSYAFFLLDLGPGAAVGAVTWLVVARGR